MASGDDYRHILVKKTMIVYWLLQSGGGLVNSYGLASSQIHLKAAEIHTTVAIDKVAASGGYMMAAVADHIILHLLPLLAPSVFLHKCPL